MEGDSVEGNELCDAVLRYINQALMEDDLEDKACMIQGSEGTTLYAVEKSFYEILNKKCPSSSNQPLSHDEITSSSDDSFTHISASSSAESVTISRFPESFHLPGTSVDPIFPSFRAADGLASSLVNIPLESPTSWQFSGWVENSLLTGVGEFFDVKKNIITPPKSEGTCMDIEAKPEMGIEDLPDGLPRGRKNLHRDESDLVGRSNKHLARYDDDSLLHEIFNSVLNTLSLPDESNGESQQNEGWKWSDIELLYGKRGSTKRYTLDMKNLLLQCMQSVAESNKRNASTLLKVIRLRSSPQGDGCQRLAHYFANGLEARLLGDGSPEYKAIAARSISDAEILKSYRMYISTFPFMETSYFFATQMIMELAEKATTVHVIHLGIIYGIQWPPLIQRLSTRPGGPPLLRITGIDLPQAGFRPDSRVNETGRHLASYCEKFNVPFQYKGIAKKWESLRIEDLGIDKDEVLVVNCLYQLMHLLDDTAVEHSPRDAVLDLIRRINPDIFINGIVNGTYNSPFFISRFREALAHFSSVFDMLDINLPRDSQDRLVFEREIWGKEIVNVIASEGINRVERPETYKHWQNRMLRAGLRQLPLNQGILKTVKTKLKLRYHKNFFVDESNQWLLEGWKGRVIIAFSCWKPA